ncbi:MAG: hypothetical protein V1738_05235 [Patescibacteria group bacterium]
MSDQDKDKDKGKDASAKPLEKARVDVDVEPKHRYNNQDREYAERAKRRIQKSIKEAIEKPENKKDGAEKQLQEADRALNRERDQASKERIDKIKVKVSGVHEDENGNPETITREREVKPGD